MLLVCAIFIMVEENSETEDIAYDFVEKFFVQEKPENILLVTIKQDPIWFYNNHTIHDWVSASEESTFRYSSCAAAVERVRQGWAVKKLLMDALLMFCTWNQQNKYSKSRLIRILAKTG